MTRRPPAAALTYEFAPPGRWTEDAACRRYPAFAATFTDAATVEDAAAALRVCAACPVRAACLEYGQQLRADGVWGGRLLQRGAVRPGPRSYSPKRRAAS